MKISIYIITLLLFATELIAQGIDTYNTYLTESEQVIFVTTPNWNSTTGTLQLYERKNENRNWKCVMGFPVTVGRSGLAWDDASPLPKDFSQKIKHEGDGNSPAGIFSLGPVFSYHDMQNIKMPFKQTGANDLCVDDAQSIYYNRWIQTDTVTHKDFSSYENLRRNDALYEYGVWVNYNTSTTIPGNGSCIFLHVWKDNTTTTSGCTAMSRENILKLIHWLDEEKEPVLLQVSTQK